MRGSILATENQQVRINDVIEVKNGVYLHITQINTVKNNEEHAEYDSSLKSFVLTLNAEQPLSDSHP